MIVPERDKSASPLPEHPLRRWRLSQRSKPVAWGREAKPMTLEQAAALGGWNACHWSEWERGAKFPGPANMTRLCEITGLSPNDFYTIGGIAFDQWRVLSRRRRQRRAG